MQRLRRWVMGWVMGWVVGLGRGVGSWVGSWVGSCVWVGLGCGLGGVGWDVCWVMCLGGFGSLGLALVLVRCVVCAADCALNTFWCAPCPKFNVAVVFLPRAAAQFPTLNVGFGGGRRNVGSGGARRRMGPFVRPKRKRQRGDLNPCGQSPMDFKSISLTTRTHCLVYW